MVLFFKNINAIKPSLLNSVRSNQTWYFFKMLSSPPPLLYFKRHINQNNARWIKDYSKNIVVGHAYYAILWSTAKISKLITVNLSWLFSLMNFFLAPVRQAVPNIRPTSFLIWTPSTYLYFYVQRLNNKRVLTTFISWTDGITVHRMMIFIYRLSQQVVWFITKDVFHAENKKKVILVEYTLKEQFTYNKNFFFTW